MKLTNELLMKAKEAKSLEELIALVKAEGIAAAAEELEKLWNSLHGEGELVDDLLDKVAGGFGMEMEVSSLMPDFFSRPEDSNFPSAAYH